MVWCGLVWCGLDDMGWYGGCETEGNVVTCVTIMWLC